MDEKPVSMEGRWAERDERVLRAETFARKQHPMLLRVNADYLIDLCCFAEEEIELAFERFLRDSICDPDG